MNTITAAQQYIAAKQALEAAEKAKAAAEALLKEAYAKTGVTFEIVDGTKVALIEAERTGYDADLLAGLVKPAVLKKVTKMAVDAKKFRAAVEIGTITPEVADAVTTATPYTSVRVTALSAEAKADARGEVAA